SIYWAGVAYEVWDLQSNKLVRTLRSPGHQLQRVAFARDCKSMAIHEHVHRKSTDSITIWDLAKGSSRSLEKSDVVGDNAKREFSPDGVKLIAFGHGQVLVCWDVASGKKLWNVPERSSYHMAFHPDGRTVVLDEGDGQGDLHVRDTSTGRLVPFKHPPPAGT